MVNFFTSRQYPHDIVIRALEKVKRIDRKSSLRASSKPSSDRPILIIPFHPHNLVVKKIVQHNWNILSRDPLIGKLFSEPPLIAFKRQQNLRDMLVHSRLSSSTVPNAGTHPCANSSCSICPFLDPQNTVTGPNKKFTVTRRFTCSSPNVVYAVRCTRCGILYVGETGRLFSDRITEHLADIRHSRLSRQVAAHFLADQHSLLDFRAQVLWGVRGDLTDRRHLESWLISHLGTMTPKGLNRKS